MKKIFITIFTICTLSLNSISEIHAVTPIHNPVINPGIGSGSEDTGTGAANIIARLLARFFSAALAAGTIFFLGYFVIGAFKWITAGGDAKQVSDARAAITQSIIGLAILASVFAIANLIAPILGLSGNGTCSFPQQICWPTL